MKRIFLITIVSSFVFQGCYTQVQIPTISKNNYQRENGDRQIEFYKAVIDTFDNDWLPDSGYYYEFNFDGHRIKQDKIDLFLNMLYAEGYDVVAAWYRPEILNCNDPWYYPHPGTIAPIFIVLLSDFNDSIINYNLYAIMYKPVIQCPFNVEEYTPK